MTTEIQHQVSLRHLNTLGLDVRAEHFVAVHSEAEVCEALLAAKHKGWAVTVLGGGSNVVFCGDLRGLVILVAIPGVLFDGEHVEVGAGEQWHHLVLACIEHGLSGLENLSLIPGSAGAAPIQNIGAYGVELESVFESLVAIHRHSGETQVFARGDCGFGYRDSIFKRALKDEVVITRVKLRLSKAFLPCLDYEELRLALANTGQAITPGLVSETVCAIRMGKLPDPKVMGNVGSFFKNPVVTPRQFETLRLAEPGIRYWQAGDDFKLSAAWLIEQCGLKGQRIGDAQVSAQHALVIVNLGNANGQDVMALRDLVGARVKERFNLALEVEPTLY